MAKKKPDDAERPAETEQPAGETPAAEAEQPSAQAPEPEQTEAQAPPDGPAPAEAAPDTATVAGDAGGQAGEETPGEAAGPEAPAAAAPEDGADDQAAEPAQSPEPAQAPAAEPVASSQPDAAAQSDIAAQSDAAANPEEGSVPSASEEGGAEEGEPTPRVKPAVPGAHLEVDIVPEGVDPLGREEEYTDRYAIEDEDLEPAAAEQPPDQEEEALSEPIASAAIDLAAGARYRATGKRKTAIARVTLRPGSGSYVINGRTLEEHFPRATLQRNIRQPLETVGYQERMDVVARLQGGGISAQAGALRHGVSRALLEADPNLRGELKRRGFLTRDSRAKERKKAGLKKARKRPQFSKR